MGFASSLLVSHEPNLTSVEGHTWSTQRRAMDAYFKEQTSIFANFFDEFKFSIIHNPNSLQKCCFALFINCLSASHVNFKPQKRQKLSVEICVVLCGVWTFMSWQSWAGVTPALFLTNKLAPFSTYENKSVNS